jgi:DHA1 family multidrug resistance protein-like MFS transporter
MKSFLRNNRSLLSLGVAALLAELAYAILNLSALPMYVTFSLKEGQVLGLIISTFLLTEAVSRPAFGALGDRIGRKPLLIAGPIVTALTSYLTIRLHGPYAVLGLFLLRAIDGLGSGALWPSAFAAIGDLVEEKNRSAAMSMLNVTYMSGLALGFLMGGAVNEYFGTYAASFYLVSILLVMAVLAMFFLLPWKIGIHHPEPVHGEPLEIPTLEEPAQFRLSYLFRSIREVPDMLVLACVVFLGIGTLMPIVKLYAIQHLGMTETQFGIVVAPVAALMGIFAVPLGRLGDKYGKTLAVCWGILGSAAAMWVLALFRSIILAGIAAGVIGLGFTVAFPAWMALVASSTASNRRGEVLGAVGMAQGLAAIVGASLGGFIYSSDILSFPRLGVVNYNVPFWFAAVLLTFGTVIAFTWVRGRHGSKDPGAGVTDRQARLVVAAAVVGLIALSAWIGLRYTRPIPPDRVAWAWMQQLVRGRPDKALKYAVPEGPGGWDGTGETRSAAKRFHHLREEYDAVYKVRFVESETDTRAVVPIEFTLKGSRRITEYVILCRESSGEWKVCGLTEAQSE